MLEEKGHELERGALKLASKMSAYRKNYTDSFPRKLSALIVMYLYSSTVKGI